MKRSGMDTKGTINGTLSREGILTFGKVYEYPGGTYDIIAADRPIFKPAGWEEKSDKPDSVPVREKNRRNPSDPPDPENLERACRRARAKVRRLALANGFRWFVTLTFDPEKVDSLDPSAVIKRMSQWASNQVKRRGLRYILVPEHHKSGRIHMHGFFSDSLEAVDSGHTDQSGHTIYNLPGWGYGFTTAIELYGDYEKAVGYVCKYIGKDGKIGGRWYYSGGDLAQPREIYVDFSAQDLREQYRDRAWTKGVPGGMFAGVNGLKGE